MKKSKSNFTRSLYAGLLSILTTTAFAEEPAQPAQAAPAAPTTNVAPANTTPAATTNAPASTPAPVEKPAPSNNANQVKPAEATPPKTEAAPASAPANTAPANKNAMIDCNYKIPSDQTKIDTAVITKWAQKATEQTFNFDFNKVDQQLTTLKACFTDQGWQSYSDALEKSGNLSAIKTQKLMVSGMVEGDVNVAVIKDNQWKVSLPMQVVYQNDKEKLKQALTINLVVGRKISGELGIMQIVAMPRQTQPATLPVAPATGGAKPAEKTTAP